MSKKHFFSLILMALPLMMWSIVSPKNNFLPHTALPCGTITLVDGQEISARILKVTPYYVQYLPCQAQEVVVTKVQKNKVAKVKAYDGQILYDKEREAILKAKIKVPDEQVQHHNFFTVVGFLASLGGITGNLVVSAIGLVLSGVGWLQTIDQPRRYKGRRLAIAGIIIAMFFILFVVLQFVWDKYL
jgi:hypothetical protein